jgi:hypothetical protein
MEINPMAFIVLGSEKIKRILLLCNYAAIAYLCFIK